MASAIKCDRCGNFCVHPSVNYEEFSKDIETFSVQYIRLWLRAGAHRDLELCPTCINKLMLWLRDEVELDG